MTLLKIQNGLRKLPTLITSAGVEVRQNLWDLLSVRTPHFDITGTPLEHLFLKHLPWLLSNVGIFYS